MSAVHPTGSNDNSRVPYLDVAILDLAGQPETPPAVAEWLRRLAADPRAADLSPVGRGERIGNPSTV
jgi:hypothetical protein